MHSCLVTNSTVVTDCLAGSGLWVGYSLSDQGSMSSLAQSQEQAHGRHPGKEREPGAVTHGFRAAHVAESLPMVLSKHHVTLLPKARFQALPPQHVLPLQEQKQAGHIEAYNTAFPSPLVPVTV